MPTTVTFPVVGKAWAALLAACMVLEAVVNFFLFITLCVATAVATTFSFLTAVPAVAVPSFPERMASFLLRLLQKSQSEKGEH